MGASNSKSVEDKAALSKNFDHPIQTSDISSGFHILEIHMPSVGMGWLSILMILAGAALLYALWRKFRPSSVLRAHQQPLPWLGYQGPLGPRRDYSPAFQYPAGRYDFDRFQEIPRQPTPLYAPQPEMLSGPPAAQPPPVTSEPASARTTIDTATC